MIILGLGGLLRDAASAVLKDGEIRAAMEEAKLNRGHAPGTLPRASIQECLRLAGARPQEVDCVAVARPFTRNAESHFHLELRDRFHNSENVEVENHQAHAASVFFSSPFAEAAVLTLYHSGDFLCGAKWRARGSQIELEKVWYYPDSLGRLYRAVTELIGYRAGADEHKVQWLSTSGDESLAPLFAEILRNSPRLDGSYFDSRGGFSRKFFDRVGDA